MYNLYYLCQTKLFIKYKPFLKEITVLQLLPWQKTDYANWNQKQHQLVNMSLRISQQGHQRSSNVLAHYVASLSWTNMSCPTVYVWRLIVSSQTRDKDTHSGRKKTQHPPHSHRANVLLVSMAYVYRSLTKQNKCLHIEQTPWLSRTQEKQAYCLLDRQVRTAEQRLMMACVWMAMISDVTVPKWNSG